MNASMEALELMEPERDEITRLVDELRRLRKEQGEKKAEMPDMTLEQQELAEKNESILEKSWEAVKKAFDFLVMEPVRWVGNQIKEHPIRTALIALAAFALWYYSAPLSAGLSALKEKGLSITADLLGSSLAIDPAQVDIFDQLMVPVP